MPVETFHQCNLEITPNNNCFRFWVHLCDIHIQNAIDIVEVDNLTAGNDITTFHVNGLECGIAIMMPTDLIDEFVKFYGEAGKIDCYRELIDK